MTSAWHNVTIRIPFPSVEYATIAQRAIAVDQELQPHLVKRQLTTENDVLVASFMTLTIRMARLSVNAFLENVDLIVRTMAEFGDVPHLKPVVT